ncbi:MAG: aminotransferase class I/II-fold pyridoxal phosphate-dependent enzyme [Burkholderiales bacterium]
MCLDQNATPLFDAVKKYVDSGVVQFHVPGHKQGRGLPEYAEYVGRRVLQMDANGMDDLDFINHPVGVIKEAQQLFAEAFGARQAYFLVNGTTSGVQAMILAACEPGSEIIVPRNMHKSVINGIILSGAIPVYVQPVINHKLGIAMGVTEESAEQAIKEHPRAKAILVINPTYYGPCSNIRHITDVAHEYGMAVIADEAHGTHFYFHPDFAVPAIWAGADLSAISVHKTGGSMTQSSALLANSDIIDEDRVLHALGLMYTSSASYPLMCSLDVARKQLALHGEQLLGKALKLARRARDEINGTDGLIAFGPELAGSPGCFDFDETKLGVHVTSLGRSGRSVELLLREKYNIQVELADLYNILSIISIGDSSEDVEAFVNALKDISRNSSIKERKKITELPDTPKMIVLPRDAFYSPKRVMPLASSVGEIAGEMIMAYPPGIPVLCIGERITKDIVEYISVLKEERCELQGATDPSTEYIRVLGAD